MAAANTLTVLVVVAAVVAVAAAAVLVVGVAVVAVYDAATAVVVIAAAVTPVVAAARLRLSTGLAGASGPFCLCLLRVSRSLSLPLASTCAKIKINSPCLLHLRWVIAYTI